MKEGLEQKIIPVYVELVLVTKKLSACCFNNFQKYVLNSRWLPQFVPLFLLLGPQTNGLIQIRAMMTQKSVG